MQKSVSQIYQERRDESLRAFRAKLAAAHAAVPGLAQIEQDMHAARANRDEEALAALALAREQALESAGFPKEHPQREYFCEFCEDRGVLHSGAECVCMKRTRYQVAAKLSKLEYLVDECFENWDLSIMPKGEQREASERLFSICREYANCVPNAPLRNLVILGSTGLGKSFALHAVGNRALERGVSVRMVTAPRFFAGEMARIRGEADENAAFYRVSLLLIDDLGAEPAQSTVAADALFALMDHRTAEGLCTCAASNLTAAEIARRYGARIASRLMDARTSRTLSLSGKDLRLARER